MKIIGRKGKKEKTILVLQSHIQESLEKSKQTKIFWVLVEVMLIFFSAYVAAMNFLSGFGIEVQKSVFILGLAIMTLFHYGSYKLIKKWKGIFILQFILYCSFLFYFRREMIKGFLFVAKNYCRVCNEYYGTNYSLIWDVSGRGEYFVTIFMLGIFMIVLFFLTYSLYNRFRRLLYLACTFPFIVAPIIFGIVPQSSYFAGYIILLIGIMGGYLGKHDMVDKKVRLRISLILVAMGTFLFYVGSILFTPDMYNRKMNVVNTKHKIQAQIEQFSKRDFWEGTFFKSWSSQDKAYGGINGGKLGDVKEVLFSNDVNLKLYAKQFPNGKMYLRGFTGALYRGEYWESIQEEMPPNWNEETIYTMDIEMLNGEKRGILAPYGIKTPTKINDGGFIQLLESEVKKKYSIEFTDVRNIQQGALEVTDYMEELGEAYMKRVFKTYRQIPTSSQVAKEWKKIKISENRGRYVNNAIIRVKEYLKKETQYSLSPGSLPKGKDFVDYFIQTNKVGYCTHYASAATIMLRALGIPARYVEGYVIDTDQREKVDGKQVISIRDTNAHAWTEIYRYGIGWVPVETTPGYTEGNVSTLDLLDAKKIKDELEKQTPTPSPTQIAAKVKNPIKEGNYTQKSEGAGNGILKFIGIFMVTVTVLALMWYVRKRVLRRKFHKIMGGTHSNAKILYLYRQISRGLEFCGISYSDNKEDYVKAVEEKCTFLREGSFGKVFEIALKAKFSPHEMTKKEEEEVLKFYMEYKEGVIQYGSRKEKIAFRCYL